MKKARGFTLIELVVTLAVIGILAALAFPSFTTTVDNNRQVSQVNNLLAALGLARSEAITHNATSVLCASSNGTSCAGGGNWATGWIVQYTPVPPALPVPVLVQAYPALPTILTLNWDGPAGAANTVTFGPTGATNLYAAFTVAAVTFTFCDNRGPSFGRIVNLQALGRAAAGPKAGFLIDGVTPIPSTSC